MVQNAAVYFIRHNSNWKFDDIPRDIAKDLFESREIAIDFEWKDEWDIPGNEGEVWIPERYEGKGKTAIRYFNELNEISGIMVATYAGVDEMLIGEIAVGSRDLKYASAAHPNGRLKTLQFKKETCRVITLNDFSLPFLIAPPFGTIVRWTMGERAVRAYLSAGSMQIENPDMYSAWHLEVLAGEFLRKRNLLKYAYYKTGKSMKDYDIVGCDALGETVLVQVKYDCDVETIMKFFDKVKSESSQVNNKLNGIFVVGKSGMKANIPIEARKNVIELEEILDEFKQENGYLTRFLSGRITE